MTAASSKNSCFYIKRIFCEKLYLLPDSLYIYTMKLKLYLLLSILLFSACISLSYFVSNNSINQFDIGISRYIQQYANPTLDQFMVFISLFADTPYIYYSLILLTALCFIKNYKRETYFILALIPCSFTAALVKRIVNRPRPTDDLVRILEPLQSPSFPSSHVLSYTLLFGFIIVLMSSVKSIAMRVRITAIVLSSFLLILIIPSRIYLGAHWFTDTIGGLLQGSLLVLSLYFLYSKGNPKVDALH